MASSHGRGLRGDRTRRSAYSVVPCPSGKCHPLARDAEPDDFAADVERQIAGVTPDRAVASSNRRYCAATGVDVMMRILRSVTARTRATVCATAFAFGPSLPLPTSNVVDTIISTVTLRVSANIGSLVFVSTARGQSAALTKSQSDALNAYNRALNDFKSILGQRRAQINSNQQPPNLPGQALYLARNDMISAYKDLTDVLPSKIGRPNKFRIPPAYFDADNEPLLDEYTSLFKFMQAPPVKAQNSDTPVNDVVDLGTAIARAKGLDSAEAEVAGRISLGIFFAETNGDQNIGNARSNRYKGSLQTGISEDQSGQKKWAAIKRSISAFDPTLIARDDKEEARVGNLDHRFNHWTAVRDGLMNAHADLFRQIPAITRALPNPIDQMKLFELIQIVPSPTKSALKSANIVEYTISNPTIMGYLGNNSIFTFGRNDRAKNLRPCVKFLTRCGSSTKNLNEPCRNSTI